MVTTTHLLTASALLMRRHGVAANVAVLAGAFAPDLSIFVLYVWATYIEGLAAGEIWRVVYWSEPWQTVSAISNSVPLFGLMAACALAVRSEVLLCFALGALVHVAFDLPFHADDAHRHFWPLTDWRFYSPLSYWDDHHHAAIVRVAEVALSLACFGVLARRFEGRWARSILALSLLLFLVLTGMTI